MSYPPAAQDTTATDSTPTPTTHAADHNANSAAINDIVAELGADPKGAAADLTARLAAIVASVTSEATTARAAEAANATAIGTEATTARAAETAKVAKSLYDANTILTADTDDTPSPLVVAASRLLGRKATGNIGALTPAEAGAVLGLGGAALLDVGTTAGTVMAGDGSPSAAVLPPNLVFDGDSLTASRYDRMASSGLDSRARIAQFGVSGQTLAAMEADASTQIDPLINSAYRNVLVAWGGTNDLAAAAVGAGASTVETRLQTYCTNRRAAGWKVIVCTLTYATVVGGPSDYDAQRLAANTWIRANWTNFADGMADLASAPQIGAAGTYDADYYADSVHLSILGYTLVADLVRAQLAAFAGPQATESAAGMFLKWELGQATLPSNLAIGTFALGSATGRNNTALGWKAGQNNTTGESNTGVGALALTSNVLGNRNTAVGDSALQLNTADDNTALGYVALTFNTTGAGNNAFGAGSLRVNTTGNGNTAIGSSLGANTTGSYNLGAGNSALTQNITGGSNTAVGVSAMEGTYATSPNYGTALGYQANKAAAACTHNVAIGFQTLWAPGGATTTGASTTGSRQTAVGAVSGVTSATQRNDIVCLGYSAQVDGDNAIAIGSGASAAAAGAIAIGKDSAGTSASTAVADEIKLGTALHTLNLIGDAKIAGAAKTLGFYGAAGTAKQTGVAVTAAGIHAALVSLNLIAA